MRKALALVWSCQAQLLWKHVPVAPKTNKSKKKKKAVVELFFLFASDIINQFKSYKLHTNMLN